MQIRDLIPWGRERQGLAAGAEREGEPLSLLQRDINRVFEDFWTRLDRPFATNGALAAYPKTDVAESEDEVEVKVDLPGLESKDVDVSVTDDALTIRGEISSGTEEKKKGYYLSERSYGAFHRVIALPPGVDTEKVDATFKNGVLTVKLPKSEEAKARLKRVEVKAG